MSDKNLVLDYYKNLKLDNTEMDTSLAQVSFIEYRLKAVSSI